MMPVPKMPRDVPCSFCGAKPGEECRTRYGNRWMGGNSHVSRHKEAMRQKRAAQDDETNRKAMVEAVQHAAGTSIDWANDYAKPIWVFDTTKFLEDLSSAGWAIVRSVE